MCLKTICVVIIHKGCSIKQLPCHLVSPGIMYETMTLSYHMIAPCMKHGMITLSSHLISPCMKHEP